MFAPRDILIIRMLSEEWTYQEIGRELGISRWTVKARVSAMRRKLHVKTSEEAIQIVLTESDTLIRPRIPVLPTEKQLACLRLAMCGYPNKLIARELGISCQAVKKHMSDLYDVLNAMDRCHAACIAIQTGLIVLSELDIRSQKRRWCS